MRIGILLLLIVSFQIFTHVSSDKFTFAVTEPLVTSIHLQNRLALSVAFSCHRFDNIRTCQLIGAFKIETRTTFLKVALNEHFLAFDGQTKLIGFLF